VTCLRYTAGSWAVPDNPDETPTFPKRDGILTAAETLFTDNRGGGSTYQLSGGYIWGWNDHDEVRLLTGQGAQSVSAWGQ